VRQPRSFREKARKAVPARLAAEPGLRHAVEAFVRSPLSVFRRKKRKLLALKDVSLEVKEGEILGLIGRNGAGKTTLLKVLSRITRPTTGWRNSRARRSLSKSAPDPSELTAVKTAWPSRSLPPRAGNSPRG